MKIALLDSYENYKGEGKDYFLFKYWRNESVKIDIIPRRSPSHFRKGLLKRTFAVIVQIFYFLPSARKYDIIFSYFQSGIIYSILCRIFILKKPLHIIFEPTAGWVLAQAYKRYPFLVRLLLSLLMSPVNCIICTSWSDYLWWKNSLDFGEKAYYVPWGLDPLSFSLEEQLEQSDYVFSAGRTARDFPTLISCAEGMNIKFVIVAGKDELTKKTGLKGVDIPQNVQVIIEAPFSQYRDLLIKSKIVVIPLKNIPISVGLNVLFQAMSLSKPIIVTKIPTMLDYLKDRETGLFVALEDAQDIRDKILFLLENPAEARRLGNNAKIEFNQKFTTKIMSENIGKTIEIVYSNIKGVRPS